MKKLRFVTFLLAILTGLMSGICPQIQADDTEVYLGGDQLGGDQVRPNVLFILDTSGSMSQYVSGTGMDRLDNMKAALKTILDDSNNVNVGLMRFTDPGGPVMFPVSNIDANIADVEGSDSDASLIQSRVAPASTDDAYQIIPTNTLDDSPVVLSDDRLILGGVPEESGAAVGTGTVGLRFKDVGIPQGVTITSASLEFTAAGDSSDATASFGIYGHLADDSPTFSTTGEKIDGRTKTTKSVVWDSASGLTEWTTDTKYQTPDLTALVQEMVDQSGWCGNNAMSFILETIAGATNSRVAYSSEGDSFGSPVLNIDYDVDSVPPNGGCFNQIIQRQIADNDDDAEETISSGIISLISSGNVSLGGTSFDMNSSQINGLRFKNITIPKDATILEADLTFTARDVNSEATTITFYGQAIDDAPTFSSDDYDISDRTKTSASVAWTVPAWEAAGSPEVSPDLTPIIQEIVNRNGWQSGNDLVLVQTSAGNRRAKTHDDTPNQAPILRIKLQYDGNAMAPVYKTVRERLKEIVDELPHEGWTPIVGTLYEAAQYYRGGPVSHGRKRSHLSSSADTTRVSHPASYTGGFHYRADGCTESNLNGSACEDEEIQGAAEGYTDPQYISPVTTAESCAGNYIVLLSDGIANHNDHQDSFDHGRSLITDLMGQSCAKEPAGNNDPSSDSYHGETCGRELARWLETTDLRSDLAGDQVIDQIFTVGFNLENNAQAVQFLRDLATKPEGFKEATNAAELAEVFQGFLADILEQPTSFAAPSLSINAFNQLFNRNEVYFSLFEPENTVAWRGNLKKYQICDQINVTGCELGEIMDAKNTPESAIGTDLRIRDTALSFWSANIDGSKIEEGGAAEELQLNIPWGSRDIYTDIDTSGSLAVSANKVEVSNTGITEAMLGDVAASERDSLIEWIQGRDVDDEDEDSDSNENRFIFEDPLHASAAVVQFGGTISDPIDKIFMPTNGGGLRLINAKNGKEEWMYIPQELLPMQKDLRSGGNGNHLYGLDLTPTIWMQDNNNATHDGLGVIEPSTGDFVRAIVGMRRGGRNYYAIEAAPTGAKVTDADATDEVQPTLLWKIIGGSGDFLHLGQTWSQPKVTRIRFQKSAAENIAKEVVIFGGGHDPSLDKSFGESSIGNIVYVVDAKDGSLIASIGGDTTDASLTHSEMRYPIPSAIALLDSNGDNATDRLYFGDLGGQVWRVDLKEALNASSTGADVGLIGKLADLSIAEGAAAGPLAAETRKFYAAPDVVQVFDNYSSNIARFDYVLMIAGNRPDPLNQVVHNSFYALRDFKVSGLDVSDDNGGPPDGVIDADFNTLTRADLFNATGAPLQLKLDGTPVASQADFDAKLADLKASDGWYVDLKETDGSWIGEKGVTKPIVLQGKLFFTTFLPEVSEELQNACRLAEGGGRLYGMDLLTASALFEDWDNDDSTLSQGDVYVNLGGGIPSRPVPIIQKKGITIIVGSGGGATSIDPGIALPRARTYWTER